MSVDQTGVVDFLGIDRASGVVVLTVSDHLPWDFDEHLLLLQEKLNAYLRFVESGEMVQDYPEVEGRHVLIRVICRYAPDQRALSFLARVKEIIEPSGIGFDHQVSASA